MGQRLKKAGMIERVGGLSVLAFMLIKKFPTSQYFTKREGKKLADEGKREELLRGQ